MEKYVLIVAGGTGSRFGTEIPKQFVSLKGKPILMHAFDRFRFLNDVHFVLVLPKALIPDWQNLCEKYGFTLEHQLTEGGPKRFHSVKSGLKLVPENSLVAIHDGVRPLVSEKTIQQCFSLAEKKKSAVPVIQFTESLRQVDKLYSSSVNRDEYRIVQTPQVFHSTLIKKAYHKNFREEFTDDAMVFENDGNQVFLAEGNPENIKITTSTDLLIANALVEALI